jgi:hypothetical protein
MQYLKTLLSLPSPPPRAWRRGKSQSKKPEQKANANANAFDVALAFPSPPLLFMEERVGRGGLLNIAFAFKAILKATSSPQPSPP